MESQISEGSGIPKLHGAPFQEHVGNDRSYNLGGFVSFSDSSSLEQHLYMISK